jgi:hypothetical protein
MSYENPRKTRLLKEALGDERGRLPSVGHTFLGIGLIAASVTLIALAGLNLPENVAAVPVAGQRHAELTLPIAPPVHVQKSSIEVPETTVEPPAPAETGNVVDLTF